MLASNKNKGPRACLTCAKAKSRCVPGPVPNVCERCQRLRKPCGSQTPAPIRRRRLEGATGGPDAAAAGEAATSATAQRPKTTKPTRVSELERRLEDLTSRLETVSRQQQQQQQQQPATTQPDPHRPEKQILQTATAPAAVPATASSPSSLTAAAAALAASTTTTNFNPTRAAQSKTMPYYPMTHIFGPNPQVGNRSATAIATASTADVSASSLKQQPASVQTSLSQSQSQLQTQLRPHTQPHLPTQTQPQPQSQPQSRHQPQSMSAKISPSQADHSPSSSSNNNQSGSASDLSSSTAASAPDLETEDLPPCNFFPPFLTRRPHTPPSAAAVTKAVATGAAETPGATNGANAAGNPAGSKTTKTGFWPQAEEAEMLLQEFRSHLMPLLPFVLVPAEVSSSQLLATQPLTWKGVMMVACHLDGPRQILMGDQILGEVVNAAFMQPQRSIDVLQALQLVVAWFHYNVNTFQMNNLLFLARGITVALGLSEPPQGSGPAATDRHTSETLAKMRCFAGTFYLVTIATTNKKPDTMMNSPYLETCCQVLERHMEYPSDEYLVQLVRIQQLAQAIVVAISLRNAGIQMDLSTGFLIENFSQRIGQFKAQLPEHFRSDGPLACHIHLAEVVLYEVALQDNSGQNGLSLPAAERLNLLSACMRATRDYMRSRFAEPVQEQPVFVCLTAFDFIYVFLVALRLMTFQMPGWDPRRARQELAFDYVVNRQIFDMQQLAQRRSVRSFESKTGPGSGANTGGREGGIGLGDGDGNGGGNSNSKDPRHRDPFQRLATRLVELRAMISRELDRLPPGPTTASTTAGTTATTTASTTSSTSSASSAEAMSSTRAAAVTTSAISTGGDLLAAAAADTTGASMADPDLMTDMAGDFDIGMIDAAPAIFSFADATIDYMQNLDSSAWPDLFTTPGLDSYMDINLDSSPFADSWDMM